MNILFLQYRCGKGHIAVGVLCSAAEREEGKQRLEKLFEDGVVRKACGICGGAIELLMTETDYTDWDKAMVWLVRFQMEQLAERAALDAAGLTHDIRNSRRN